MSSPRDKTPRLSAEAVGRIERGARRGRETTSEAFAAVITRKRFSELVGIHRSTLKRWEAAKVVQPEMRAIRGIRTAVFSEADVEFGRRLAAVVREQLGTLTLQEAARIASRT